MFMNSRVLIVLLVSLCITSAAFVLLSDLSTESYDYVADTNQYSSYSIDMSNASPHSTANLGHSAYGSGMSMPKLSRSQGLKLSKASISPTAYTNVSSVVSTPPSNGGGWRLHTTSSAEYTSFGGGNISNGYSNATGTKRSTTLAQASTTITAPMYTSSNVPTLLGQTASTNISASIANPGISAVSAAATPSAFNQSTLLSYNGGIITETYGGMSLSGSFGNIRRIGGLGGGSTPGIGEGSYGAFFQWLIEKGGAQYADPENNQWWFLYEDVYAMWLKYCDATGTDPSDWENGDFMTWFESDSNNKYFFPIPDGTIMLMLLVLGYALYIYRRSRKEQVAETK